MRTADAILAADLHIRDSVPSCRTDDYFSAQEKKLKFIQELSSSNNDCPIYVAGDFLHTPKISPFLEAWIIKTLKLKLWTTILGQHDLINHSIKNYEHSSIHVLEQSGLNVIFRPAVKIASKRDDIFGAGYVASGSILMLHTMVFKDKPIHEAVGGIKASHLLDSAGYARIILTGDNHQTFVEYGLNNTMLINPGSMMRMSSDQAHHLPCVFLWYDDKNKDETVHVKKIELPIEEKVISSHNAEVQKQRDERIDAFISRLNENYEIGLSFGKNIENYFSKNKTRKPVRDFVWEAIGENHETGE